MHIGKKTDADQEFGDMSGDFNFKKAPTVYLSVLF